MSKNALKHKYWLKNSAIRNTYNMPTNKKDPFYRKYPGKIWTSVNDDEKVMKWSNFQDGYPTKIPNYRCIISLDGKTMVNEKCQFQACPICRHRQSGSQGSFALIFVMINKLLGVRLNLVLTALTWNSNQVIKYSHFLTASLM